MDTQFKEKNYCDFRGGECAASRQGNTSYNDVGCCYGVRLGVFKNTCGNVCMYLSPSTKQCTTKNISCKLFTCGYLEDKGVYFDLYDFPKIKKIFNRKQIEVLKRNHFRSKEQIIDKLLATSTSLMPFILFDMLGEAKIK